MTDGNMITCLIIGDRTFTEGQLQRVRERLEWIERDFAFLNYELRLRRLELEIEEFKKLVGMR